MPLPRPFRLPSSPGGCDTECPRVGDGLAEMSTPSAYSHKSSRTHDLSLLESIAAETDEGVYDSKQDGQAAAREARGDFELY